MELALDTATGAVSVAVQDGAQTLSEVTTVEARRHTEILAPSIQRACARAGIVPGDLDRVVVGVGPGPFTGLRVGIACALTVSYALGLETDGVCSLDAIAYDVVRSGRADGDFVVATDARRKEVYWARYAVRGGRAVRCGDAAVAKPADLPVDVASLPAAGRGPMLYPDCLGPAVGVLDVSASALASFAFDEVKAGRALLPVRPLYLRQPDAAPATSRKSVLP